MKKKFISKKRKKRSKYKFLFFLLIFLLSIYITFQILLKSSIKINDKDFVKIILSNSYSKKNNTINELVKKIKKDYSPVNLLMTNYYDLVIPKKKTTKVIKKNNDFKIYIYNTHQTEEYAPNTFLEGQVKPTVMMASYIMEDVFIKNGYSTLVEERSISEQLKNNNWKYYKSYDASRIYIDDTKKNNPTIEYFIDVHRDSLPKDKTTVEINNKSYAKTIFLIGTENPNYQENLDFVTRINNILNEKYPNLSKGIYQKGGRGVNGVYNQDNSKHTMLVEIGGPDNTTDEVLNSTLAFCDAFLEVISKNEG